MLYIFLTFFVAVQIVYSTHEVDCPDPGADEQPYCSCPVDETVCEFTLTLENRPTFTSFELGPDGELLNSGTPYILDSSGYRPALVGVNGPCLFENVTLGQ